MSRRNTLDRTGRMTWGLLLLVGMLLVGQPALADNATTRPPQIGRLQTIQWNGQGVNQTLDGTLLCAAFGGPDNIPPPAPFDQLFFFDDGSVKPNPQPTFQFRPCTIDPAVTQTAVNDTDRDQNWIYVFQFINDAGDDGVEGGAIINGVNIALPPKNSALENAIVSQGVPGIFITEYGATATEMVVPGNQFVNYSGIVAISEFFFLTTTRPVLQPSNSSALNTTEAFFYYSPFSPSNRNASILGQEVGQSRSHTLENTLVTAQFWPQFKCEFAQVGDVLHDPVNGEQVPVRVTVSNQNMVFDTNDPNEWVLDANRPGNLLDIFLPATMTTRPQHDRSDLLLTSAEAMAGCISFRATSGGANMGSLMGVVDIDRNKDPMGAFFTRNFDFFIFIEPGYFANCTSPLQLENLLSAQTPYDKDPPFEGWMFAGGPPGSLPQLDSDPTDPDGFSCTLEIGVIPPPDVLIEKKVQFLDLTDPMNPLARPMTPQEIVDSPPCGCVLFTVTVTADPNNMEDITSFTFRDQLPAGMMFMGVVSSSPPGITAMEGPPGRLTFAGVPNLGPGMSAQVSFKACVNPGTPAGSLTNTAVVSAVGAITGLPTTMPTDDAMVNVVPLGFDLNEVGVSTDVICPPQTVVFTFQACNTGSWPLEVTIPMAGLGAQLGFVGQNPAPGTVVVLDPDDCVNIQVTASALGGGPANMFTNCATLTNVTAHPDQVDPGDARCNLLRTEDLCVDVIDPNLIADCLQVVPTTGIPGDTVMMTQRVTNTGNVTLSSVAVSCVVDPNLIVNPGDIPSSIGPIAPGAFIDILFPATIRASALPNQDLCVDCSYTGHPAAKPPGETDCDRMVTNLNRCCVTVEFPNPEVMIQKKVQFLDLTDPMNPVARPMTPQEIVDSPPCGCVLFTIAVTAASDNLENLTGFVFTDALPLGLTFNNFVMSPDGITGMEGPPGTITFMNVPDLAAGQTAVVSFRACVAPGTMPSVLTNVAQVMAVGAISGNPTSNPMDGAQVNVVGLNMAATATGVDNPVICPPQTTVAHFEICNTGMWPLVVRVPGAAVDSQLQIMSQNPATGTLVTLQPTECQTVDVTVRALGGGPAGDLENCVRLNNIIGHPEDVDPGDRRCDLTRMAEQCLTVIDPAVMSVCLTVPNPMPLPGETAVLSHRVTNTGNVTLDTVAVSCVLDAGLTVEGTPIPSTIGPIAPGAFIDVTYTVRVAANRTPREELCVNCTFTAHPAPLPPGNTSCNKMAMSECCVTVGFPPPTVMVDKKVQFLDLTNPGTPVPSPASPVEQVTSPPCGCVKFTLVVTADAGNFENLNSFVFTDLLPPGLTFAGFVQSPNGITAVEGPPGTITFSNVPNLAPGASATVCFRACVAPGTPEGILTNTTTVKAMGVDSGLMTNTDMDDARVDVARLGITAAGRGAAAPVICPPQETDLTIEVCNTGEWPLRVTIPAATDNAPFLQIVSQNPAAGTVVTLNPTSCQQVVIRVRALMGGPAGDFENCIQLNNAVGHPAQVDPADTRCDVTASAEECVDVIDPALTALCLSVTPDSQEPGMSVIMRKRVTNTGNVTLDTISVSCVIDAGLSVPPGQIPTTLGPLAPGASTEFQFTATLAADADPRGPALCVDCTFVGHPAPLAAGNTSCNKTAMSSCCVTVLFPEPKVMIEKKVQFVDLTDPGNPVLQPASPVEKVSSPPCGCVKFTIVVTADAGNFENLTTFNLRDLLPAGLEFAGFIQSAQGITGVQGPPGTIVFSGVPDLAPGASATVCFRACVVPGTPPGTSLTNTATVQAVGATSGRPSNMDSDTARVNVVGLNIQVNARGASPDVICPPQVSTFSFEVCNTGAWPLLVTIPQASVTPRLMVVTQDPVVGTQLLIPAGECRPVSVVAKALGGGTEFNQCVRLNNVPGHPQAVNPADTRCDVTANGEQCLDVIDSQLVAICASVSPPRAAPGQMVTFTKRLTNTGNVTLDTIAVSCQVDPLLIVGMGQIPAQVGPLAPGESLNIVIQATLSPDATPDREYCIVCNYDAHPSRLPPGDVRCNAMATSTCCVSAERLRIPTLSEWGLILLASLLGGLLILRTRRP